LEVAAGEEFHSNSIRGVIVVPIFELATEINNIRNFVQDLIVID
jgi:hypothetical protein